MVFIDTSVLTNLFDVPNKNADRAPIVAEFERRRKAGQTFVLPMTAIIETGNHSVVVFPARRRSRSGPSTTNLIAFMPPDPYPRTPYLWRNDGGGENTVAGPDRASWFGIPLIVEEKIDGANVSLWMHDGRIRVASRGGVEAMDRAGQLGRLRAWVAEHDEQLRPLLSKFALYGEWLWLEHSLHYEQLPDWLVALDLWSPSSGMMPTPDRDQVLRATSLVLPPRILAGMVGDADAISALLDRRATWGDQMMEGLVLRRVSDDARCKVVRAGFVRRPDEDWNVTTHNRRRQD